MRVLIGCERSGVVRDAFRAVGADAWSCDTHPDEHESKYHIVADVLTIIRDGWDLAVFHPPCTRLCNSGVRWLHERNLWNDMRAAAQFFLSLLNAPIPRVAVENPVMHRYAREIVGRGPDCTYQPWQHGHPEKKRSCLWLRGIPCLKPSNVVAGPYAATVHRMPPGPDRAIARARTLPGVAQAMSDQWHRLLLL